MDKNWRVDFLDVPKTIEKNLILTCSLALQRLKTADDGFRKQLEGKEMAHDDHVRELTNQYELRIAEEEHKVNSYNSSHCWVRCAMNEGHNTNIGQTFLSVCEQNQRGNLLNMETALKLIAVL